MIKKVIILCLVLGTTLMADFRSIKIPEFEKMQNEGVVVIDIRRPDEWKATGIIKGSIKNTFFDAQGRYDLRRWLAELEKHVSSKSDPIILVCAHANRTKTVGRFLSEEFKMEHVYDLDGGINYGWIDLGKKTIKE